MANGGGEGTAVGLLFMVDGRNLASLLEQR